MGEANRRERVETIDAPDRRTPTRTDGPLDAAEVPPAHAEVVRRAQSDGGLDQFGMLDGGSRAAAIIAMQQQYGNAYVQRLVAGGGPVVQRWKADALPSASDEELQQRLTTSASAAAAAAPVSPGAPAGERAQAPAAAAPAGAVEQAGATAPAVPGAAEAGQPAQAAAETPAAGPPLAAGAALATPPPTDGSSPASGAAGGGGGGGGAGAAGGGGEADPAQEAAAESVRKAVESGEPEGKAEVSQEPTQVDAPTIADVSDKPPVEELQQGGDAAVQAFASIAAQTATPGPPPAPLPDATAEALPTIDTASGVAEITGAATQAVAARDTALAMAADSAAQLGNVSQGAAELQNGQVAFASSMDGAADQLSPAEVAEAEQQRAAASDMISSFMTSVGDSAQQVAGFAAGTPDRLQAAAEASVAAIEASIGEQSATISSQIAELQSQAASEAQAAREAVAQQYAAAAAAISQATATAREQIEADLQAALQTIQAHETAQVQVIEDRYREADQRFRDAGRIVGEEAVQRGNQMADAYMQGLVDEDDSFLDGPLTYNQGKARADTAHQMSQGYQKGLGDEANKQADQAQQGKPRDIESVHTAARHAAEAMQNQRTAVLNTLADAETHALQQAEDARNHLVESIDHSLDGATQALSQHEVALVQGLRGGGQAQAAAIEQQTAESIAAIHDQVAQASSSLLQIGTTLAAQLQGQPAPSTDQLAASLATGTAELGAGVAQIQDQLEQAQATAEQQVAQAGQAVVAGLDSSSQQGLAGAAGSAASITTALAQMGASAAEAFNSIQQSHESMTASAATAASGGFSQAVDGLQQSYAAMSQGLQDGFARSAAGLEQGLRGALPKMEDEIRTKAEENASHVPPRWKSIVKWILIIAVIVVVALVIGPFVIGAVGAAFGTGAVMTGIIAGAIVGGVTSATIQVINNWAENKPLGEGVLRAAVIGAIGGAVGGGVGAWVGQLGQQGVSIANTAFKQFALNTISNIAVENVTNLVTGNWSWASFGMSIVSAVAVGGAMHAMSGLKPVSNLQQGMMEAGEGAGGAIRSGLGGTVEINYRPTGTSTQTTQNEEQSGQQQSQPPQESEPTGPAHNAAEFERYKQALRAAEAGNDAIEGLQKTGQLPPEYMTKAEAEAGGWQAGKALKNTSPGRSIGGDVFENRDGLLPSEPGRTWHEADVGMDYGMSRAKNPGTRLMYSSDGLLYVTADHYKSFHPIGQWK